MRAPLSLFLALASLASLAAVPACGGDDKPPPQLPPQPSAQPSAVLVTPPIPAPTDTTPPPPPTPPKPTIADTTKLVLDAFNAHDGKKMATGYADAASLRYASGKSVSGRDAIATSQDATFAQFQDVKITLSRTWTKGQVMIAEYVVTGTDTGGDKATKRAVGVPEISLVWFDDNNLIKEQHVYGDSMTYASQLDPKAKAGTFRAVVSPPSQVEAHVAKGTPDEDKLVDWAKGLDLQLEAGKEDDVMKGWADDGEFQLAAMPAPAKGTKDVKRQTHGFLTAFPAQKWDVANAWGIDGFAIVEHSLSAKQMGALGPFPASKKDVTWHAVSVYTQSADGRIAHEWVYLDMGELAAQVKPAAPAPAPKAVAKSPPGKK